MATNHTALVVVGGNEADLPIRLQGRIDDRHRNLLIDGGFDGRYQSGSVDRSEDDAVHGANDQIL